MRFHFHFHQSSLSCDLSSFIRRYAGKVDRRAARTGASNTTRKSACSLGRSKTSGSRPKSLHAVKVGMEAGADYMEEVKKRGRGRGLGAPYTHVAAAFVESSRSRGGGGTQTSADDIHGACGSEAGNSDRVLWSVQGEGGVLSGRNPSSSAQGEGDDDVQRARSAQERGRGRGNAGRRARGQDVRRAIAPEAASLRQGCWPMRKETDSCPVAVLRRSCGTGSPVRDASCRKALPRRNGQPRPCWRRLLRRRAQRRAPHLPCSTEGKPNASVLTVAALKRHCLRHCGVEQWQTQSRPSPQ